MARPKTINKAKDPKRSSYWVSVFFSFGFFVLPVGLAQVQKTHPLTKVAGGAATKEAAAESQRYYLQSGTLQHPDQLRKSLFYADLAVQKDPSNIKARFRKGLLLWELDRSHDAIIVLAQGLKLCPGCTEWTVYDALGNAYYFEGRKQEALNTYSAGIAAAPREGKLYFGRGSVRLDWQQSDLALKDFCKAIELKPRDSYLWDARGSLYEKLGDHKKALADLTQAIKLNSDNPAIYAKRAKVYQALGQMDLARQDLNKGNHIGFDELESK